MNAMPTLKDLMPLLPELLLSVGAMALLMLGVIAEKRNAQPVNVLSTILLLAAAAAVYLLPAATHAPAVAPPDGWRVRVGKSARAARDASA